MKSKLTITAKIFNPGVHNTKDGAKLYLFSMGISQQDKQTEKWINIYLPVTIFDKENQHGWILQSDKKEITVEGQLTIKNGYTKRDGTEVAPHLGFFGFEAYIGKKPQRQTHENATQATQAPQSVSIQQRPLQAPRQENYEAYRDPVADITMPSEEVPF